MDFDYADTIAGAGIKFSRRGSVDTGHRPIEPRIPCGLLATVQHGASRRLRFKLGGRSLTS